MIPLALILLPALFGLISLTVRHEQHRPLRRVLLLAGTSAHAAGTLWLCLHPQARHVNRFVSVDLLGLLFLCILSALFLACAVYSVGYFHEERRHEPGRGVSRLYVPCMMFFLAAMTLTVVTPHLGLLWIAIEATTLASAPLIYYHRNASALEATWKYLLICSVGIALALLGIFFLACASRSTGHDLTLPALLENARNMDTRWLRIAFILVLVGLGTKMGLAPLHNWLPDAHSEAPSPVSALLSGALLNCAFLGILRFYQICSAAGLGAFCEKLLLLFGLFSMFIAALFLSAQKDYKRLLAYSSIENMGILALGIGVKAGFGSLLHAMNHSMAKGLLFLTAGRILLVYRSKNAFEVRGLLRTLPVTGFLFALGVLAITGSPPFSPFVSEFIILREGLAGGHVVAMILYLVFLGAVFVSMSRALLPMTQGRTQEKFSPAPVRPDYWLVLPPLALGACVALFGMYLPSAWTNFFKDAAALLGDQP